MWGTTPTNRPSTHVWCKRSPTYFPTSPVYFRENAYHCWPSSSTSFAGLTGESKHFLPLLGEVVPMRSVSWRERSVFMRGTTPTNRPSTHVWCKRSPTYFPTSPVCFQENAYHCWPSSSTSFAGLTGESKHQPTMEHKGYVYMMTTTKDKVIYIGVTNSLKRRVQEHAEGRGSLFTSHYSCKKLVYWEAFSDIEQAIAREKRLKRYKREWKIALIESVNPEWKDLSVTMAGDPSIS